MPSTIHCLRNISYTLTRRGSRIPRSKEQSTAVAICSYQHEIHAVRLSTSPRVDNPAVAHDSVEARRSRATTVSWDNGAHDRPGPEGTTQASNDTHGVGAPIRHPPTGSPFGTTGSRGGVASHDKALPATSSCGSVCHGLHWVVRSRTRGQSDCVAAWPIVGSRRIQHLRNVSYSLRSCQSISPNVLIAEFLSGRAEHDPSRKPSAATTSPLNRWVIWTLSVVVQTSSGPER